MEKTDTRERVHDLLNPVASIHGCAATLRHRGDALAPDVRRQLLDVIIKQADALEAMIRGENGEEDRG